MEWKEQSDLLCLLMSTAEESIYMEALAKHLVGKSPSYFMEVKLGELIRRCLEDAKSNGRGVENENCLILFNAILPQLPPYMEKCTDYRKMFSTFASVSRDQLVHQLVSGNMDIIITTVDEFPHRTLAYPVHFCTAFLKVLKLASDPEMSRLLGDGRFFIMISTLLKPRCEAQNLLGLIALAILIDRGGEKLRNDILDSEIVVELRRMLRPRPQADAFYKRRHIENLLVSRCVNWESMQEAIHGFIVGDIGRATVALVKVIESYEEYSPYDFVTLFGHLEKFLYEALDQKNENKLRTFLTVLLDVSWPSEDVIQFVSLSLKKLHFVLEDILTQFIQRWKMWAVGSDCGCEAREYCLKAVKCSLSIMKCLYILNHSWHQWFDITSSSKVVSNHSLLSPTLAHELHNLLFKTNEEQLSSPTWPILKDLCKIHPCAFNFKDRKHIFNMWRNSLVPVAIPITNDDSIDYLSDMASYFTGPNYRWHIHFLEEQHTDFYHNVAEEFQKQSFNIWMESGNVELNRFDSSLCICPPNGLFPNILESNNQHKFYLLGQYIARLFVDNVRIDIPLSLELFTFFLDGEYSKYSKKYYDLMKIMPEAEQVIKQLLKIKRRKFKITSDASLTEGEKSKMITELRLGGGVKFEDVRIPFVMPLTGEELKENGAHIMVTPHNVEEYLSCLDRASDNISRCANVSSIRKGFESCCPIDKTSLFSTKEFLGLCKCDHLKWTERALLQSFELIDGYTLNSEQIVYLATLLTNLNAIDKRKFIHFVTGSARPPRDGLAGLRPKLKISRLAVTPKDRIDSTLPKVSTLHHVIYLPEYSSGKILKTNLMKALEVN